MAFAARRYLCCSYKKGQNLTASEVPTWKNTKPFVPPLKEGIVIKVYDGDTITIASKLPFKESRHADHPIQFYAATKRSNELMAHSYSHLFNLATTGIRFFTAYGPWGRPDMALYKFTKNIMKKKNINVFNKGQHSRDFTYIDDTVDGILKCLYKIPKRNNNLRLNKDPSVSAAPFRVINIGKGKPTKLINYIKIIESNLGRKAKKKFLGKQMGDVKDTWANVSKANKILKYKAKTSPV